MINWCLFDKKIFKKERAIAVKASCFHPPHTNATIVVNKAIKEPFATNQGHDRASCCSVLFCLLAAALLKSRCLFQANILSSRGRLCQGWLWENYKKGKPIFPRTFFHYRKEVFRSYRDCQWKLFRALGKHHLVLYLVFLLATSSITGQHDPSIVGFSKKRRLYACMRTKTLDTLKCSMQVLICGAYVQLTGLWNISICISPSTHKLCSWCGHGWTECICGPYHVKCWIRSCFMLA